MAGRYRAVIAYDGTAYCGFQRLPNQPSILGALEGSLAQVAHQPIPIIGAGRTDTGVHASGQVIAFDFPTWQHSPDDLLRAWNITLPTDIVILRLEIAPSDFHPRYAALSRTYHYQVYEAPIRHPLMSRYTWHVSYKDHPLNGYLMNTAAAALIGVHDFGTFGKPPLSDGGSQTTWREIMQSMWAEPSSAYTGKVWTYTIEGNAFLYRMVRTIVGTLMEVGVGRLSIDTFIEIFRAAKRSPLTKLAPAHGLTLTAVNYR